MLDIHRLRILRSVAATGSVSAAAALLGYSPSAISQHVTALQRETGLRLTERVGRGIALTAAGRALAAEAEHLMASLSGMESLVADLRAGRVGTLSLGYFSSAGTAWIPTVVAALVREFPDLRVDLGLNDVGGTNTAGADVEIVVDEQYDAVLGGYRVHPLMRDSYLAILPQAHPAVAAGRVPLADLAGERWVDSDPYAGYCRQVTMSACAEAGFTPQFRVQAPEYATAISFVSAGVGVAVMPSLAVGLLPPNVRAVPVVAPAPSRRIGVAVKDSVAQHPAALRVVELLKEQVGAPVPV
jgi:DNA-binding transcriptional LysR family regulator